MRKEESYCGRSLAMQRRRRRRRQRGIWKVCGILCMLWVIFVAVPTAGRVVLRICGSQAGQAKEFLDRIKAMDGREGISQEEYPQELVELLEKNEEAFDFVQSYPKRGDYMGREIDLMGEYKAGKVPLLMQWDRRWGYDSYGDDMIGLAGCGPTCMTMAYLYLTGDTEMDPRQMAEYAYNQGYYTEVGTSWSFFTEGAAGLGLDGKELPLSEGSMKGALDEGALVICSMGPGDFTTTGHFILLRGYDEGGFYVNDPNRKENSQKQWSFEKLSPQIKCLWRVGN